MEINLDIVNLIEKNPIVNLSKEYQNELINKIKEKFTNKEQQLFAGSFYCYLNYHSKNDFIVNLDDVWKWIGFARKDPAKRLLEKYFIKDIDFKILLHQSVEQDFDEDGTKIKNIKDIKKNKKVQKENEHGGHNKEQILMTINTFKKFCLKAGTKKADEIHDYYIKLEELLHETINEETEDLRNQLQIKSKQLQKKDDQTIDLKSQLKKTSKQIELDKKNHKLELKINRHAFIVELFKTKKGVYLDEIKENEFIKLGCSGDLDSRGSAHKRTYGGNTFFLDAFECVDYYEVEKKILSHADVIKNLYREKINGHSSTEVVKLTNDFNYQQLLAIVKQCVSDSQKHIFTPAELLEKQRLDIEQQKISNNMQLEKQKLDYDFILNLSKNKAYEDTIKENLKNVVKCVIIEPKIKETKPNIIGLDDLDELLDEFDELYKFDDDTGMEVNKRALVKSTKGRKIQQIDPNNLEKIIKVYPSIAYVFRDVDNVGFESKSLQQALNNNKIYKNFRWCYVKSGDDPNVCKDIQPTKVSKHPISSVNCIMELNSTKTEITDTFPTRGMLSKKLKIGQAKMIKIISDNKKHDDHYYVELSKCPRELIEKYDKPLNRHVFKNAKQIKQINPITKQAVIFNSMSDLYRRYGIKGRTVEKAINDKVIYQGYMWEFINV